MYFSPLLGGKNTIQHPLWSAMQLTTPLLPWYNGGDRKSAPRDWGLSRGRGTDPESEGLERKMALTRKMLRAMGIEDEKIDQIIEAHGETVDALKAERDALAAKADQLDQVTAELDKLKARPDDGFKEKYEAEHAEFEAFKAEVDSKNAMAEKRQLYRQLLQDAGIDPKRQEAVLRVADLDSLEVENGEVKDREDVVKQVADDWADFVVQSTTKPAPVPNPPTNPGGNEPEPHNLTEALRQKYSK